MFTIIINGSERRNEIDERWINQEINRRREQGVPVCVKVVIETSTVHMTIASQECSGFGGNFNPNQDERRIIDCWSKNHLNKLDFRGGNLIAFLRQSQLQ